MKGGKARRALVIGEHPASPQENTGLVIIAERFAHLAD